MQKTKYLILFFLISGCLFAQEKLTLEKAISIGLQRNSSLIKSKNSIKTDEAGVKSAYGDLLPNFGLSGSWSWRKTKDEGGTQTDFFGNTTKIPPQEIDSRDYSVSAGGRVTLFDGLANYANISKNKNNLASAKYALMKQKQDVVYQVTSLFYDVLYQKALLRVREDNVKYNQKFLETVQERNKLGSVPIADVYSQQVQAGNAELQFIQAQNNYEAAKNSLLNYLALDVLEEYEVIDPTSEELQTNKYMSRFSDVNSLVNVAMKNRFDYKSQMENVESAENSLTISRSGYLPSLSGNYSFRTSAVDPSNLFDRKVYSAGLSLDIPIFSNFNTEYQTQLAKVQLKNTEEDLFALERQIKIEAKQGLLDLQAAQKQVDVSTKNVRSALENRKVNNERYRLGSGTILDVLQSDKDYQQALSDMIFAKYQFFDLKDKLLNVIGELDFKNFE